MQKGTMYLGPNGRIVDASGRDYRQPNSAAPQAGPAVASRSAARKPARMTPAQYRRYREIYRSLAGHYPEEPSTSDSWKVSRTWGTSYGDSFTSTPRSTGGTYRVIGDSIYGPDGVTRRIGNSFYGPRGTSRLIGNTLYTPGGTYRKIGNSVYGPDGVSRRIGNTIYGPNGSTTRIIGNTYYHTPGY